MLPRINKYTYKNLRPANFCTSKDRNSFSDLDIILIMSVSKYEDKPVDCSAKIDLSNLAGKSAIITGGTFNQRLHSSLFSHCLEL